MYVQIPSSIFYFILGVVVTFVIEIILLIIYINKTKVKRQKQIDTILKSLQNSEKGKE